MEFLVALPLWLKAVLLGVVEGLTEFLPISSTGHLILGASLLDFEGQVGAKAHVFEIVIQTGAILAVVWEYRQRLLGVLSGVLSDREAQRFVFNVGIAFLPLAILGLLFGKYIKAVLFAPVPVATAFIVGGFVILWAERLGHQTPRIDAVEQMSAFDALKLGLAQAFALIPGTSRSGATIIGGMLFGLSRKAATEFSFFLAIPTLILAGLYDLYKNRDLLSVADVPLFAWGLVASFISAFICVKWLLAYVASHDFKPFAWYRIAFGVLVLISAYTGWIDWRA